MIAATYIAASTAALATLALFALELRLALRVRALLASRGEFIPLLWPVRIAARMALVWPWLLLVELVVSGATLLERVLGVRRG